MTEEKSLDRLRPGGKEAFARDQRINATPVSKAELDERKKHRAKPVYSVELTPGGTIEHVIRQSVDAENERRMGFIEKRLAAVKGTAKARFNKVR
ncbi:MAG: hypothetical protein AAFV54_01365 [Pseudomonadota bacterium]